MVNHRQIDSNLENWNTAHAIVIKLQWPAKCGRIHLAAMASSTYPTLVWPENEGQPRKWYMGMCPEMLFIYCRWSPSSTLTHWTASVMEMPQTSGNNSKLTELPYQITHKWQFFQTFSLIFPTIISHNPPSSARKSFAQHFLTAAECQSNVFVILLPERYLNPTRKSILLRVNRSRLQENGRWLEKCKSESTN